MTGAGGRIVFLDFLRVFAILMVILALGTFALSSLASIILRRIPFLGKLIVG